MAIQERVNALPNGQPIGFDIYRKDGTVQIPAGTILSEEAIQSILARGLFEVSDKDTASRSIDSSDAEKLLQQQHSLYSEDVLENYEKSFQAAFENLGVLIESSSKRRALHVEPLSEILEELLEQVVADTAAVLSCVGRKQGPTSEQQLESLKRRSIQLATLGMAIAHEMGSDVDDCRHIGLAAMLHDLSLACEVPVLESAESETLRDFVLQHPLRSSELIARAATVPSKVRIVIGQIHEQNDGTGYPRKLRGHQVNPLSRILNLVDAYLCLLEPHYLRGPLLPSDAMAYLTYQAIQGTFDRQCMCALLSVASIYPIQSYVKLDNSKVGVVLVANVNEPAKPVVMVLSPPFEIVDLRVSEKRIVEPIQNAKVNCHRLRRSQLTQVLWTHPLLRYGD